jgi:hypothetical protein
MTAAILLFLGFVLALIIVQIKLQKEDAQTRQRIMSQYKAEDAYVSGDSLIGLNFKARKIILASGGQPEKVYDFAQISAVEIVENGATLTQTNRGSQLLGAVVGGLAFGGVGAVVGALSGSSRTRERLRSIALKITVDDHQQPVYTIYFFRSSAKKGADRESVITRMQLQYVERFHGHIVNAMRQSQLKVQDSSPVLASSMLMNDLKEELFQLEVERGQGRISEEQYQGSRATLTHILQRKLKGQIIAGTESN